MSHFCRFHSVYLRLMKVDIQSFKDRQKFTFKKKNTFPIFLFRVTVGNMIPEVKNYFTTYDFKLERKQHLKALTDCHLDTKQRFTALKLLPDSCQR